MPSHAGRVTSAAAWVAAGLGTASAVVSAYWAAGGTALLDTVGGSIERWGRQRSAGVVVALVGIAVLKVVVAAAAPILARAVVSPLWMTGRVPRILGWVAAVVLTVYGVVLTAAGLLVELGAVDPRPDADRHALAWHTRFWDPWFLLWGCAFATALWTSRAGQSTDSSQQVVVE